MNNFSQKAITKFVHFYERIFRLSLNLLRNSNQYICPCCSYGSTNFIKYGIPPRKNALCPKCGSLERHRLFYLFLERSLSNNKKISILHFSPEACLSKLFKSYKSAKYTSADLRKTRAEQCEDITQLSFKARSFDLIFCSHVLEHVKNDIKAMKEMSRVLKPNSLAIILVPVSHKAKTEENTMKVSQKMQRNMVLHDHVRNYGADFKKRIFQSGLKVKVLDYYNTLDRKTREEYCLRPEKIFLCYKKRIPRWFNL